MSLYFCKALPPQKCGFYGPPFAASKPESMHVQRIPSGVFGLPGAAGSLRPGEAARPPGEPAQPPAEPLIGALQYQAHCAKHNGSTQLSHKISRLIAEKTSKRWSSWAAFRVRFFQSGALFKLNWNYYKYLRRNIEISCLMYISCDRWEKQ